IHMGGNGPSPRSRSRSGRITGYAEGAVRTTDGGRPLRASYGVLLAERVTEGSGGLGLLALGLGGGRSRGRLGGLVELLARRLHGAERDDLALEEHRQRPVGEDPDLTVPGRHGHAVVATVHVPGETALELDLHLAHDDHRDALVQAETGD